MVLYSLFFLALAAVVFSFQFYSYLDSQVDRTIHGAAEEKPSAHEHVLA